MAVFCQKDINKYIQAMGYGLRNEYPKLQTNTVLPVVRQSYDHEHSMTTKEFKKVKQLDLESCNVNQHREILNE